MTVFGVDYSTDRPTVAELRAAGVRFVCRYVSTPGNPKNLTRAEAEELSTAGIAIVTVFETTARRALAGRAAGAADARAAASQARACGMPDGRPVYFAVDFDATPGDQAAINVYLAGAGAVLGRGRVGIYGGYWPVSRALDAGAAAWAWQTYAWSGGHWDPRAHIRQYSNGHRMGRGTVDHDHAMTADFGGWTLGDPVDPPAPRPVPDDWQVCLMRALPTLRRDDRGLYVRTVQGLLCARGRNVAIDGVFGPDTERRVREEQAEHGATVDGIVGPETWTVLITGARP